MSLRDTLRRLTASPADPVTVDLTTRIMVSDAKTNAEASEKIATAYEAMAKGIREFNAVTGHIPAHVRADIREDGVWVIQCEAPAGTVTHTTLVPS